MKVYELMQALSGLPSGADARVTVSISGDEDGALIQTIDIEEVYKDSDWEVMVSMRESVRTKADEDRDK